ncbi:MAG: GNAT family N-acetyltransferase [Roseiflexaceae bacterium]
MWILETERLALRQLTMSDVDDLMQILADPEAMRFYPAPFSRERTEGWIQWGLDSYAKNGFGLWAVIRKEDQLFLGDCGPVLQPVEDRTELEIGYHILRREWGRGYATEAARACRDYAFGTLKAPRVVSIVNPLNMASRRVGEKVHTTMREFTWVKTGTIQCLYSTERDAAVKG